MLWHPLPWSPVVPDGGLLRQLLHYPSLLKWSLTPGAPITSWADNPAATQVSPLALHVRLLPAWLAAAAAGSWSLIRGLKPQSLTGHVAGPCLLEGKEAIRTARLLSKHSLAGSEGWVKLHPALDRAKRDWTRHTLIYGGVGSGKTQIVMRVVEQVIRRRMKAFILDTKGDYTSRFPEACILSPWDRRSRYWDIAADVDTPAKAAAFASSVIPDEPGPNRYFTVAAQLIFTGCIRALQAAKGLTWTWRDLDALTSLAAKDLAPVLAEHYRKAHPLITSGESSTASVMASLAAFTSTISQLAEAFGDGTHSDGSPRKRLSLTAWARDSYRGKPAIIAQAGPDPSLSQRYLAAAINILVPEIISPTLPDDVQPDGRAIWFVLDELAAIGKVQLGPLIDKGRSKAVSAIIGVQDQAQVAEIYGDHFARALAGMVGTHIVCQLQMGETREQVASLIGSRRVSITAPSPSGGHAAVHEEQRQLVQPSELTTRLGFRRGKRYGSAGFGIRALLNAGTEDLMILDWPGLVLPERRPAFVPARWTKPTGARETTQPAPVYEGDAALLTTVADEVKRQLRLEVGT